MKRFAEYLAEAEAPEPAKAEAAAKQRRLSDYLAEAGEEEVVPPQSGRIDVKSGTGFVPDKPARAVFTDMPGESFTAKNLGEIKEDTLAKGRAALAGGALDTFSFGFGDEAAAALGAATGQGKYTDLRNENRKATKDAQAMDPAAFGKGQLAGGLASIAVPGAVVNTAKPLLSLANTGRAAALGGATALGSSEADLTKGEVGGAALDVAKGAAVGAGVNTLLGGVAKGAKSARAWVAGAPERVAEKADAALVDSLTLGAPASKRDALFGPLGREKDEVLRLVKADPRLTDALKAGDRATAAEIVQEAKAQVAAMRSDELAEMMTAKGEKRVAPILAALEKRRASLAENPAVESQRQAAVVQKQIDAITERFIPAPKVPPPKGKELVGKLVESADTGEKQRAGLYADEWAKVAEKHKLGKVSDDIEARVPAIKSAIETVSAKSDKVYAQAKEPVRIFDATMRLREWADELRKQGMREGDAANVDAMVDAIIRGEGRGGKRLTMPAKEMRALVTSVQENAFAGKYIDPGTSKSMQREAASILKNFLDEHVEKTAGAAAANRLREANKEMSALLTFRNSAEKELAKARLAPVVPTAPETRTGKAPIADLHALSRTIEDPDMARDVTGALYQQIGKKGSRTLAGYDRQEDLLKRLEDPLAHKAARESSPPTTLRHHTGSLLQKVRDAGTVGGVGAGITMAAMGQPALGASVALGSIAAKYGPEVAKNAERYAVTAEYALRKGANMEHLQQLGRMAKLPAGVAEEIAATLLPREAASWSVNKKEARK